MFQLNKKILSCFIVAALFPAFITAQKIKYTAANAHAHNDYEHPVPFYTAFEAGFGSIEADVFPVEGVLLVAHYKKDVHPGKTLKGLYLEPLLKAFASGKERKIKLLIDIKENYKLALPILIREIQLLEKYLSVLQHPKSLTVIISGNRPPPAEYKNYPDYIFFDDDLKIKHTPEEWERVGLVSLPFNKISTWKGDGSIPRRDKKRLRQIIDSVHAAGKTIRFWAAPDTRTSWKLQMKLKADLIGTDKISELEVFLKN